MALFLPLSGNKQALPYTYIKQTPPGLPTKTGGSELGGFHHVFISSLSIDFSIFLPGPKSLLIFDLFPLPAVASKSLSHPRCAFSSAVSRFGQLALMPSHYGEPSLVLALLRSIFGSFCSSISAVREVLLYESPFPERVSGPDFLSPLDSPLSFWLHCTTFSQGCQ